MIMLIIPIKICSPRWLNAPAAMFTSPGPRWSSELELLLFTFAFTLWWSGDGFNDQVINIAKKVAKCKMGIFSSDPSSTILWTLLLSTEEEVDHYLGFTKLIIFKRCLNKGSPPKNKPGKFWTIDPNLWTNPPNFTDFITFGIFTVNLLKIVEKKRGQICHKNRGWGASLMSRKCCQYLAKVCGGSYAYLSSCRLVSRRGRGELSLMVRFWLNHDDDNDHY